MSLEVRQLRASEWQKLRDTRLRALRESPDAFLSSYDDEVRLPPEHWTQWSDEAVWVAAFDQGLIVGLAGLMTPAGSGQVRHIESIWVAPAHRRLGVFRSLLSHLVEVSRALRLDDLFLWVVGDNEIARRAYTRLGFVPTGEVQPLNGEIGRSERRLRLRVGP